MVSNEKKKDKGEHSQGTNQHKIRKESDTRKRERNHTRVTNVLIVEGYISALQHASRSLLSWLVESCREWEFHLFLLEKREQEGRWRHGVCGVPCKTLGAVKMRTRGKVIQNKQWEREYKGSRGGQEGKCEIGDREKEVKWWVWVAKRRGRKLKRKEGRNRRDGLRRAPGGIGSKVASSPSGICPCL